MSSRQAGTHRARHARASWTTTRTTCSPGSGKPSRAGFQRQCCSASQQRGYAGGISQLKAWIAPFKKTESELVVRFETPPGKQMQADFTTVRRGRDLLLALVATMGYSRASFVKFTRGEDAATLRTGLREAFDYFGGVPEHVLFDNAKSVVIDRDAYGEGMHRWNDELKELAEACGFTPRLCRPYRAKTMGKVERFNSYLKGSFVVPLAATLEAGGLKDRAADQWRRRGRIRYPGTASFRTATTSAARGHHGPASKPVC